jgi:hypothetical protein
MSGQRAPNKNDNCMGWHGVPHSDQNSSSTSAQYAPKGKGKSVTASGFTQPGTPTEERRREGDEKWRLDGARQNATIGNAIADKDRKSSSIACKDWAKKPKPA